MKKFFITVRSISGDDFGNSLGAIRYLAVPDGEAPKPSHRLNLKPWLAEIMATFPPPDNDGNIDGNLLFFVHGFNVTIAGVDDDMNDIRAGLAGKLDCTVVGFDWPSAGETYAYLSDLDTAKRTAIDLVDAGVKPLLAAQTDKCRVALHVLCHSMGAYVTREALDHADDGLKTGSDWMINQLVMIAGDVDAADFVAGNKDTESMLGHAYRITNYFNLKDAALQISNVKRAGVAPRVGRVGLPENAPASTVNVDCSKHFDTLARPAEINPISFSHSWYFKDATFYVDLAETLRGAVDRTVITGRTPGQGRTLNLKV